MIETRIWITSGILAAVVFTSSFSIANDSRAAQLHKKEMMAQLKLEEEALRIRIETMAPARTSEERDKINELGHKLKETGLAVRALDEEINPVDLTVKLEGDIQSLKGIFATKGYYSTKINHPSYGKQYARAAEILAEKKARLTEIEQDLQENNKPVEQLVREFEEVRDRRELWID